MTDRSVLRAVSHHSLLCPSRAQKRAKLERGQVQLTLAIGAWLRGCCQSGRWVDPDNMVGILPVPGSALRRQPTAGSS